MNPIAARLNEASVLLEDTPHPELVEALRIGAEEIQRLQERLEKGVEAVWDGRRFYFKVLKEPQSTPLAIIFNDILEKLGQSPTSAAANAMYERYYPTSKPDNGEAPQ